MSVRRTSWLCTMAAVPLKTSRPSSAAPWLTMWCLTTTWESYECGPTRRADSVASACCSHHLLIVSASLPDNTNSAWTQHFNILFPRELPHGWVFGLEPFVMLLKKQNKHKTSVSGCHLEYTERAQSDHTYKNCELDNFYGIKPGILLRV